MNSPAESISRFTLRRLLRISWDSSSYHSSVCQELSLQTTLIFFQQTSITVTKIIGQSGSSASNLCICTSESTTFQHTQVSSLRSYKYLSHYIRDKDVMKPNEPAVEISKKNKYCTSASTQQTSKATLTPGLINSQHLLFQ